MTYGQEQGIMDLMDTMESLYHDDTAPPIRYSKWDLFESFGVQHPCKPKRKPHTLTGWMGELVRDDPKTWPHTDEGS